MASTTFILSLLLLLLLLALFSVLFSPPEVEPFPALELLPGFSGLFPEFDCCCYCCWTPSTIVVLNNNNNSSRIQEIILKIPEVTLMPEMAPLPAAKIILKIMPIIIVTTAMKE
jgi:hypothetical protein